MVVIQIQKYSEVKGLCHGYAAEPSVESASQQFKETYGRDPIVIYQKIMPSGRSTIYIEVESENAT